MASSWSTAPAFHIIEPNARAEDRPNTVPFPPSSYTPRGRSGEVGDVDSHQYFSGETEASSLQRPVILPAPGRVSDLPLVISFPIAVSTTLVLNVPLYILSSVGANAWSTSAVEYAIGSGCVGTAASLLLVVEKRWSADTVHEWKAAACRTGWWGTRKVELAFLLAYTAALFSSVPRMGYSVHSMYKGALNEGLTVLIEAFWGVVPCRLGGEDCDPLDSSDGLWPCVRGLMCRLLHCDSVE